MAVTQREGDIVPDSRELRTNCKLIPKGYFMQFQKRTS